MKKLIFLLIILSCFSTLILANTEVLEEPELYQLSLKEMEPVLFEQYIKTYNDQDPKNFLNLLYNYLNLRFKVNFDTGEKYLTEERYRQLLVRGIETAENHNLYFDFDDGIGQVSPESTLAFFWNLAKYEESTGNYQNALVLYLKTRQLFIETGEKLWYDAAYHPNLDGIEGKIYTLKIKIENK